MKAGQIQAINDELLRKTGVDFSQYRNQELSDSIANAMTFPLFFARSIARPVGLFLLATVVAIVLVDNGWMRAFLAFPGLILAGINGFLLGLVLFVYRIRKDMDSVFSISADLSLQVMQDIGATRAKLKSGTTRLPSLVEIVQGVNAIIILPMVIRVLDRKIPLFGGVAARITEKFFGVVDTRLALAVQARTDEDIDASRPLAPEDVAGWLDSAERAVETAKGLISVVVGKVGGVVAFPFLAVFVVVFSLSAGISYLLYGLAA